MADVTLTYKGATIGELSESGNKTIETAGKYCEADILLEYVKSEGGGYIGKYSVVLSSDCTTYFQVFDVIKSKQADKTSCMLVAVETTDPPDTGPYLPIIFIAGQYVMCLRTLDYGDLQTWPLSILGSVNSSSSFISGKPMKAGTAFDVYVYIGNA